MKQKWTIRDLLLWTTNYFANKGMDMPRLEAEVLLAHVLNKDRVYLYTNYDLPVNQLERQQYREVITRRVQGEPAAYIVGYKEFMSLKFLVNSSVLIPRPDTEILVEKILELPNQQQDLDICDVGTGSGAIAVSLGYYLGSKARITAIDSSPQALEVARANAARYGVDIEFCQGDLLTGLSEHRLFDVIVANLPYIPQNEYQELDQQVKGYEPVQALLAPGDGLDIYRRLMPQAWNMLKPKGFLFIEIGFNQGQKAQEMARDFTEVEIIKDLAGHDRVLKARKG